jgi:hypothetical protein
MILLVTGGADLKLRTCVVSHKLRTFDREKAAAVPGGLPGVYGSATGTAASAIRVGRAGRTILLPPGEPVEHETDANAEARASWSQGWRSRKTTPTARGSTPPAGA